LTLTPAQRLRLNRERILEEISRESDNRACGHGSGLLQVVRSHPVSSVMALLAAQALLARALAERGSRSSNDQPAGWRVSVGALVIHLAAEALIAALQRSQRAGNQVATLRAHSDLSKKA
jgi:hypothetical protein